MTQGFVELVVSLLEVANEAGALSCGYKGKPYNYYDDIFKAVKNIKKQDKQLFEKVYNELYETDDFVKFDDVIKDNTNYIQIYQKGEY